MFYIYHHLGLGDHIICNGMVRHFLEQFKKVSIFCHSHYSENIRYLYRDNEDINIMPFKIESEINTFLSTLSIKKYKKIGFGDLDKYINCNTTFDQAFYDLANLPFEFRFNKFFLERDLEIEKECLSFLNPQNEKYIYIHDDPIRGFSIDPSKYRQDLKIIKNNFKFNLFNMLQVIENAEEIHIMQTGMLDLINSIKIEKPKIYLHGYVRKYSNFFYSKGINPVQIIL